MVPMAVRPTADIKNSFIRGAAFLPSPSRWQIAQANLKATPTPHKSPNG
jgi:hypothetical protein